MSYIPPHRRHSSSSAAPPTLQSHQLRSSKQNPRTSNNEKGKSTGKLIFASHAKSMWFPVVLANDSQLSSTAHLEPCPFLDYNGRIGQNPLILVLNDDHNAFKKAGGDGLGQIPWDYIAEKVQPYVLSSFESVKNEMMENKIEEVIPTLIARFGKLLFQRDQSFIKEFTESSLRQLQKSFYTNVPLSYLDYVITKVVPKLGLTFESEKELYYVKLSDNKRPDSTISCKCTVAKNHKTLDLVKVELNQLRHLVANMSCLGKSLDMRLMLCTKRIMTTLTDDEIESIKLLISHATLDPKAKGGLTWPLIKDFPGDRYTVCGVWHTTANTFRSSTIRLKVRQADRFDFRSLSGEDASEVIIKLRGIVTLLKAPTIQSEMVSEILKDNLKLIWENFLSGCSFA